MTGETENHIQNSIPAKTAWLGLAAVYIGFLTVGMVFHFVPPVLPVAIPALTISHSQAGWLMSLFALPGVLLSLPGGWLVDRFGERLVGGCGLVLMGLGTIAIAYAPWFYLILIARVISGIGATVAVVSLQRMVARLFQGKPLGIPLGISGSAIPIGIVIVLNIAGPLSVSHSWRDVALLVGFIALTGSLIFICAAMVIFRGHDLGCATVNTPTDEAFSLPEPTPRAWRAVWIAGAIWITANGAMTAFMTFAPDNYLSLGFSLKARGLFTSIPMWGSALLAPLAGYLADKHGGKPVFIAVGMLAMSLAIALTPGSIVPPVVVGLALGLALAAVVTPLLSLPVELLPAAYHGRGFGLLSACANLGILTIAPLAGMFRDWTGGYWGPFILMAFVALSGAVIAEFLRRGRYTPSFGKK